jgi:hypothetical protein
MIVIFCVATTWRGVANHRQRQIAQHEATVQPATVVVPPLDAVEVRHQLAALDQQAELHERLAVAMLHAQAKTARPPLTDSLVKSRISADLAENRERTARLMLDRGDRLEQQPDGQAAAIDTYQRMLTLFPDSLQAAAARQRLERIGI